MMHMSFPYVFSSNCYHTVPAFRHLLQIPDDKLVILGISMYDSAAEAM